ncbi:MAG: cytochrome c oxidase subunit 2 [Alphaproteobacteria bacterium]|jgi:cytochrome c oxidase subunit 2
MLTKTLILFVFTLIIATSAAYAGTAHMGGFQNPVGAIAQEVDDIYNFIFYITGFICLLVEGVILYSIWRFRRSKNKKAATFSHNTPLEIFWLTVPAIICVVIAWKSFEGMRFIRSMPEEAIDIEVMASQFAWDFDYPDVKISAPDIDIEEKAKTETWLRELTAFNDGFTVKEMVVPINTNIRLHVTSKDVIHAFYVPALMTKIDAMPGRINYQWFNIPKIGSYIGQCAELCGAAHGQMYFSVKAVSQADYTIWVNKQRVEEDLSPLTQEQIAERSK